MYNLYARLLKVAVILLLLIFICYNFFNAESIKARISSRRENNLQLGKLKRNLEQDYNIWIIFTKVVEKSPLTYKFKSLIINMLNVTTVPLKFHLFVDDNSKTIAVDYFDSVSKIRGQNISYTFYDVAKAATLITDIVTAMMPHFSSKPGTYYSDALFYLSLGLYRIAPETQKRAVMLDCDLYFKEDVALLFEEFQRFDEDTLFGLAPELTPVYRHVLHTYRTKHKTTFGEYYHPHEIYPGPHARGFQGYNSGVILLNLSAIRKSDEYNDLITKEAVKELATKYNFKGHLGDQDFYTLLGYEHPHLIRTLNCGFNKQLCTWWRDNGYKDVFDFYARCEHKIVLLHGNCNTKIPTD